MIRIMMMFEYKVVPAPAKGTKAKGVKTPHGRFAVTIEQVLNDMAADGWEFQRAELLPSEERQGLTGSTTQWRNLLVFRRATAVSTPDDIAVQAAVAPDVATVPVAPQTGLLTATAGDPLAAPGATPVPGLGAREMQADDGVEELSPVSGLTTALKTRAKQQGHDDGT